MLSKAGSRYALGVWGAKLVDKVFQLTHVVDSEKHRDSFQTTRWVDLGTARGYFDDVLTLWRTLDPDEFLDRYQHLLRMDNGELGKCTILRRRLWIIDAESAMKTRGKQQQQVTEYEPDNNREQEGEPKDMEE